MDCWGYEMIQSPRVTESQRPWPDASPSTFPDSTIGKSANYFSRDRKTTPSWSKAASRLTGCSLPDRRQSAACNDSPNTDENRQDEARHFLPDLSGFSDVATDVTCMRYRRRIISAFQQWTHDVGSTICAYVHNVCHWSGFSGEQFHLSELTPASSVSILGRCFAPGGPERGLRFELQQCLNSLVIMSYRKAFPPMYRVDIDNGPPPDLPTSDDFPPESDAIRVTSDAGWGCAIRCAQMLLFHTLVVHFGRGCFDRLRPSGSSPSLTLSRAKCPAQSLDDQSVDRRSAQTANERILRWFLDVPKPRDEHPFSIFAFVRTPEQVVPEGAARHGLSQDQPGEGAIDHLGKQPGDWFGPVSTSYSMKHMIESALVSRDSLCVYVDVDGVLDVEALLSLASGRPAATSGRPPAKCVSAADGWQLLSLGRPNSPPSRTVQGSSTIKNSFMKSTLVCFPLTLGNGQALNRVYHRSIARYFGSKLFVGAVGSKAGRKQAFYFVGKHERLVARRPCSPQRSPLLRSSSCSLFVRPKLSKRTGRAQSRTTRKRKTDEDVSLLYLDPHVVQPCAADVNADWDTFHRPKLFQVDLAHLDPSLLLAFYCRAAEDVRDLVRELEEIAGADAHAPLVARGERREATGTAEQGSPQRLAIALPPSGNRARQSNRFRRCRHMRLLFEERVRERPINSDGFVELSDVSPELKGPAAEEGPEEGGREEEDSRGKGCLTSSLSFLVVDDEKLKEGEASPQSVPCGRRVSIASSSRSKTPNNSSSKRLWFGRPPDCKLKLKNVHPSSELPPV